MKNRISKRDWESISAYLDGQLSPRQQSRLETRLQKDHQLQVTLNELRNSREMLRNAPRLTAPRNFFLTPEMVGKPVRLPRLAPIFGWASALASFLFILVLMGDLFNAGRLIPAGVNIPQQQENLTFKSQVADEQAIVQPPVAGELAAPTQEIIEEPVPEAVFEQAAPQEAPLEPASPSTPTQAALAEGQEIEMFTQVDEPEPEAQEAPIATTEPETQEEPIDATATGETLFVSPALAPTAQDEAETEAEEPQEEVSTVEPGDNLTDISSVAETAVSEYAQDQVAEMALEEESTRPQEQVIQQPTVEIIETQPVAVPSPTITWIPTEVPVVVTQVPDDNTDTVVFGAEVILALFAVATGLAWFYMRLRGG